MKAINDNIKRRLNNISLAFASGVLGFLAFPPFDLSFTAWICMVPLFFLLKNANARANFLYSYIAGLVFFAGLLYWLVNVTVPGMIFLVIVLAFLYAIFGLVAGYMFKYSFDLMILPFVWVVLEYIRSNLFTGFPWGLLGMSQYENINLIQIADITGVYGISFVVMAFNVGAFAFVSRSKRRVVYTMASLLFLIVSTSYGIYRLDNQRIWGSPRIGLIQGNIPQQFKWDETFSENIVKTYSTLTLEAENEKPDIIIWPETSYPYLVSSKNNPAPEIDSLSKEIGVPILAGAVVRGDDGKYYNSALFFDGTRHICRRYDKTHLVPFGEYIPFENRLDIIRGYIDKPIGNFGRGKKYSLFGLTSDILEKGTADAIRHTTMFYKFGVMICFEDIFPYIARELTTEGANFLVNMTNDAWFGHTAAARQHLQSSVFRAVENKVPVVRAANTGITCFINPYGKIYSMLESEGSNIFVEGWSADNVDIMRGRTYYSVYGDIFAYFCGIMMCILLFSEAFISRKNIPGK